MNEDDAVLRVRERLIMLILWTIVVTAIGVLGAGFGGGFGPAYSNNPLGWALLASPAIPLVLWLKARRDLR